MGLVNNNFAVVPYVNRRLIIELTCIQKLDDRLKSAMKRSLKAQFRDYNQFHRYWTRRYWIGDIVVLVGTSTAGKTSIIQAIKQLEQNRVEDGLDLRGFAIDLINFKKYNSDEFEILKKVMKDPLDIPKAIYSKERVLKAGISSQEKIEAEEAIQRIRKTGESFSTKEQEDIHSSFQNLELAMFDEAFAHSRRGGSIIFDVLNIDLLAKQILIRNFNDPIRAILVYCPFHVLSSRMEKRNREAVESGEFSNLRIGAVPLMQFSDIFTQKEKGQKTFEILSRKQVIKAFDENFDKKVETDRIEGNKMPSNEQILIEKDQMRDELLGNLGFKDDVDVVEVAPKNQAFYHHIINTSETLPEESAKIIHNGTYRRYM